MDSVSLSIGVDNGILVWLDGAFIGGELRPGGASLGEHVFDLGDLGPGGHHLQLIREDHGGSTGYAIELTATRVTPPSRVPESGSTLVLACLSLIAGVVGFHGRRGCRGSVS